MIFYNITFRRQPLYALALAFDILKDFRKNVINIQIFGLSLTSCLQQYKFATAIDERLIHVLAQFINEERVERKSSRHEYVNGR
jgi:hypothetical protein